jgi:hypothetical protein
MTARISEVKEQFARWQDAIKTGKVDIVVALYAFNAVLVPTLSNDVRNDPNELSDYFRGFLNKQPSVELIEGHPRLYGDIGINSGLYKFKFGSSQKEAFARFSFVYQWSGTDWLIVEHHSSLYFSEHENLNKKGSVAVNFKIGKLEQG